jgi:hypothetical protein
MHANEEVGLDAILELPNRAAHQARPCTGVDRHLIVLAADAVDRIASP